MPNPYKVTVRSAVSDGTNIFLEVEVSSGAQTYPLIRPTFRVGTTAATIRTYLQTIANNQPTLADDVAALTNSPVQGA
jgi:hypothetical protein